MHVCEVYGCMYVTVELFDSVKVTLATMSADKRRTRQAELKSSSKGCRYTILDSVQTPKVIDADTFATAISRVDCMHSRIVS